MEVQKMISHSEIRDFVVGIDYEDVAEDRGHFTLRRKVCLNELVEEIKSILQKGSTYPQFPPEAKPSVLYAWDMNNPDDGDCYHEIMAEIDRSDKS